MNGSDLPRSLRSELLKNIEEQVGAEAFGQIMNSAGEDAVIDLALRQAKPAGQGKATGGFWSSVSCLLMILIAYAFGIETLGGQEWWHHILALPLGMLFLWVMTR